jgi:UDP-2,3-diacylglucosamine pyrophosphatase LpxH
MDLIMKTEKRKLDIVVLSDLHLGTRGCHAKELLEYLRSIQPKILILNGDIVDIWQFSKRFWPNSHMKVVKYIIGMAAKNTKTYYITGNHDEMLRKFAGLKIGNLHIVNKLELDINGENAWFFHGDVFDVIMQHSKWLAKLGAIGYDSLIMFNLVINRVSALFGRGKVSLAKKIKENVKSAVSYINNFEETAANLAVRKGFSYIICGHIHHPVMRTISTPQGDIRYLNSGDWIENLTSLEFVNNQWSLYHFTQDQSLNEKLRLKDEEPAVTDLDNKQVFKILLEEFYLQK